MKKDKIREAIATLYWQAHSDGRLCGKNGKPDFGLAAIKIEETAAKFGCTPNKGVEQATAIEEAPDI